MKDRLDEAIELYKQISNSCDDAKKCKTCKISKECDFYCDFASPMDVSFYLNQIGDLFSKEPSIQLKNIDLSSVKPNEQMKKFNEEVEEFIIAVEEHNYMALKCKSHMIEEFWDVVQSGLGLLHFEGVEAKEVMEGYQEHLQKMEARGNKPREKVQK